jgi:Uma2 family endonuclease
MEVREPAVAYGKQKYTIEEYLEMENASTVKHEYYKGEIYAMSGAKVPHNDICGNLFAHLWNKLKGKSCKPYNSDTRIHVEKNTLITYPDVSVVCGPLETLKDDNFNVLNPTIIIEVLSDSTRDYDRGDKFDLYKHIPTLREYIMVDSEFVKVEAWYKNELGKWVLTEYDDMSSVLELPSVSTSITLEEIYEGVRF